MRPLQERQLETKKKSNIDTELWLPAAAARPTCGATLVEIGETLLLLLDGRRGGCTQDVLEGAPGAALGHQPRLLVLQERCQRVSGTQQSAGR